MCASTIRSVIIRNSAPCLTFLLLERKNRRNDENFLAESSLRLGGVESYFGVCGLGRYAYRRQLTSIESRGLPRIGDAAATSIFDDLSFTVHDGDVTLIGEVRNPVLKGEAASAVKHLAGVNHVDNEIQILPASFNDDRIRREMVRALFRDSQLFRYSLGAVPSIHIIVNNGHVSLRGVVANQGDKNVAGIRANGVPDVFSVDNELQVEKD